MEKKIDCAANVEEERRLKCRKVFATNVAAQEKWTKRINVPNVRAKANMRGDAPDVVDLEGGSVLIAVERDLSMWHYHLNDEFATLVVAVEKLFVMHVQDEEKRLYIVENAME